MKFPGFPGAGKDCRKLVLLLGAPHPMGCDSPAPAPLWCWLIPRAERWAWKNGILGGSRQERQSPPMNSQGIKRGLGKWDFQDQGSKGITRFPVSLPSLRSSPYCKGYLGF